MEQTTVQRRLVKSAPELWAQVSSKDALGPRLAEFGEIRITRAEPETTVAWEGERASGTVELTPTGWGTQVVLTAALAEQSPACAIAPKPKPTAAPQPAVVAAQPQLASQPTAVRPSSPQPDAPATPPAPQKRKLGFFARLFRRRPKAPVTVAAAPPQPTAPEPAPEHVEEPLDVPVAERQTAATQSDLRPPAPGAEPSPPDPDPAPTVPEPVAERSAPAALDAERTVAILTGVLDDLGASHHRSSRTTDLFSPT